MPSRSSRFIGFGSYAPERRVENATLEAHLGLEPGWINRRTGIQARHYAAHDETLTDMAVKAADAALIASGLERSSIALTLLATSTADHALPPSAPLLAHRLRLAHSGAIDLTGACAGFLYALAFADGFVRNHNRSVLIVGANILSRRINQDDPISAALFADAAGACVLAPHDDPNKGIVGIDLDSDGAHYDLVHISTGSSFIKITDGKTLFTKAVDMMTASARHALSQANLTIPQIDRWIPHQANGRILEAVRTKLGIAKERMISTLAEFGNSSAATIPFSLSMSVQAQPLIPGERLLLTAAGAGLTGGALIFEV